MSYSSYFPSTFSLSRLLSVCSGAALISFSLYRLFTRNRLFYSLPPSSAPFPLQSQTFLLTGSTRGIGVEIARQILHLGGNVILVARDVKLAQIIKEKLIQQWRNKFSHTGQSIKEPDLSIEYCDFTCFDSVFSLVSSLQSKSLLIHCLINNAAVIKPMKRQLTRDEIEATMQVNYYSPVLLMELLSSLILSSCVSTCFQPSIINVSSRLEKAGNLQDFHDSQAFNTSINHSGIRLYASSKLCLLAYSYYFQREFPFNPHISVYNVTPGMVATDIAREFPLYYRLFNIPFALIFQNSARRGASAIISVILNRQQYKGEDFYGEGTKINCSNKAKDLKIQSLVWMETRKWLKRKNLTLLPFQLAESESESNEQGV
jgi:NAD(P)-dependent dehydrogenase (short-subunit alcohol dehydrogenase family)